MGIQVHFEFSDDWTGLSKIVTFSNGIVTKVLVLASDTCIIPHECMATAHKDLIVGIYGTNNDNLIIPTVYCSLGLVKPGVTTEGVPPAPPTPSLIDQMLDIMAQTEAVAQSVRDDADAGEFDGFSPEVTITPITHGHRVTITSREHPDGQSFNVTNGEAENGDKTFVYTQYSASSSWDITHDLNKFPAVSVVDSGGNIITGNIKYIDKTHLILNFTTSFSGKAYLN